MYKLIPRLQKEARLVAAGVTAEDLHYDIDPRYTRLQQRLNDCWDPYMENNMSTTHFLKTVGSLYAIDDQGR